MVTITTGGALLISNVTTSIKSEKNRKKEEEARKMQWKLSAKAERLIVNLQVLQKIRTGRFDQNIQIKKKKSSKR